MNPVDVSVIIVNWNTRDLLLQCVESILTTAGDLTNEIIVVDNASTDDSIEILQNLHPEVICIRNPDNLGFAKANNIGIRQSHGKYLALVNSDIKLMPDCMKQLHSFMEKNQSVGMAGPQILNADLSYQPSCRKLPGLWNATVEMFGIHNLFPKSRLLCGEFLDLCNLQEPSEVAVLSGCFWFIRRTAFETVGGLDESFFFYGEDKDYSIRYARAGWKVFYVPQPRAVHYLSQSSRKDPFKYGILLLVAQLQFLKKYYHPAKLFLIYIIMLCTLFSRLLGGYLQISKKRDYSIVEYNKKMLFWMLAEGRKRL